MTTPSIAQALGGKVVWITGASSGIGEALAKRAVAAGSRVVLTSRRQDELMRVQQACMSLGGTAAVLSADLTAPGFDAEALAQQAEAFFGPIDILVNNAGISQRSRVLDTGMEVYRRIFEIDFFAPVALTKAVLPQMIARKSGRVVVISSVVGYISTPLRSGYAAAKHALHGFFDALRAETHGTGFGVTIVCPGYIRTAVSENAITGTGGKHGVMDKGQQKGMDPADCAEIIWQAVAADRAEIVIGREKLAVLAQRFLPAAVRVVARRVND